MNYRHIYHAGNFTEVVKHCVLTMIIDYLQKKDAPLCVIDTHAGAGLYDLTSIEAQKTGEWQGGVQRILTYPGEHPLCMQRYLQLLKPYQTEQGLHHYPGSPLFAYHMLRPQDQMIINEYHPQTQQSLKAVFNEKPQVFLHQRNAYELLPAILPPKQPRGVVLIDPPFEKLDENQQINLMLQKCLKRWAHGIYLIWYPVTAQRSWNVQEIVLHNAIDKHLIAELTINAVSSQAKGLLGCKLLIINPPWILSAALPLLLKHLWEIFNTDRLGGWRVDVH